MNGTNSTPMASDATAPAADGVEDTADGVLPPASAAAAAPPALNPRKKRKVALYLAYVGHGYAGMQRNPGVKTIEEDLFKAINGAGGVSDANSDEHGFQKVHWMRAARTDKGVSAVGQVVSLMMVHGEGVVDRINALLPPQIRVFGFHRVVKGFDSRKACDKRRYEYILPAWMFDPAVEGASSAPGADAGRQSGGAAAGATPTAPQPAARATDAGSLTAAISGQEQAPGGVPSPAAAAAGSELGTSAAESQEGEAAGANAAVPAAPPAQAEPPGPAFAFDSACAARLTSLLGQFEGTHNFHNYTVRTPHSAPNAKRYILSFRCTGVFDISGQPWVRLVVVGQSFMLHQIRKMVGAAVAEFRGVAPAGSLSLALRSAGVVPVPMAPELGLFLDECFYEAYNKQYAELHEPLRLEAYADRVAAFKRAHLYPHIAGRDAGEGVNAAWLANLTEGSFKFSQWPAMAAQGGGGGGQKRARPSDGGGSRAGATPRKQRDDAHRSGGSLPAALRATFNAELSE